MAKEINKEYLKQITKDWVLKLDKTEKVTFGTGNIPTFVRDISPIWTYIGSFMATINELYEIALKICFEY